MHYQCLACHETCTDNQAARTGYRCPMCTGTIVEAQMNLSGTTNPTVYPPPKAKTT